MGRTLPERINSSIGIFPPVVPWVVSRGERTLALNRYEVFVALEVRRIHHSFSAPDRYPLAQLPVLIGYQEANAHYEYAMSLPKLTRVH